MLRLLESKVVELGIVDHASGSTIGRMLKKPSQAASPPRSRDGGRARRLYAALEVWGQVGAAGLRDHAKKLKATPPADFHRCPQLIGAELNS